MKAVEILTASPLDILFEGRNKAYGAYELRTTYTRRMLLALLITGSLLMVGIGFWFWESNRSYSIIAQPIPKITTVIQSVDILEKEEPPAPKPLPKREPPKLQTIKWVTPKIVADPLVKEPPPTVSDLDSVRIATVNGVGKKAGDFAIPPDGLADGKGLHDVAIKAADSKDFVRIEKEAEYPGGTAAWRNFLERNLRADGAVERGAGAGVYKVMVQFVVDVNGAVSEVQAVTHFGFGMEEEAVRVIRKSGNWRPAILNGREVKARRSQPIIFQVLDP